MKLLNLTFEQKNIIYNEPYEDYNAKLLVVNKLNGIQNEIDRP